MNPDRMAGENADRITLPASSLDLAFCGMDRVGGPPEDDALLGWSLLLELNSSMSSPVDSSNACPSVFARDAPCDDILRLLVLLLLMLVLLLFVPAVVLVLLFPLFGPLPRMIGSISSCMQAYSPPKIITPAVVPLSAHQRKLLGTCPE